MQTSWSDGMRGWHIPILVLLQVAFVVLFGVGVVYDDQADAKRNNVTSDANMIHSYYPMFQDVNVMIFIGFGFLMTFLKRYGYSAVSINMMIAAVAVQWAILCRGVFDRDASDGKIHLSITSMLNAEFASASVLISFGAVLGVATPVQLVVMTFIEIMLFATNEHIGTSIFQAVDVGGSMFVHVFGAYFGLAVSFLLHKPNISTEKEGSVYHSDIFSMIGTVFLWMFWPSFNSAMAVGDDQHRAVINTYFSLAACCIAAFAVSALVGHKNKFNMVHVQNATLAGGVAIGTAADMMIYPYGAMLVGIFAGTVSVLGYHYLTPILHEKCRIHDTCGVNNLHGMPGIIAALVGAIMAGIATEDIYGQSLYEQFPARAPVANSEALQEMKLYLPDIEAGDGRSASAQAGYQLAAMGVTLAIALVGGIITGIILRLPFFGQLTDEQLYEDTVFFETPEEAVEDRVLPIHHHTTHASTAPSNDTPF